MQEPPFTLSLADLPGIVEGASRNRGVGHAFLKHLEYSEIIAMVVDIHGFQLSAKLEDLYRYFNFCIIFFYKLLYKECFNFFAFFVLLITFLFFN